MPNNTIGWGQAAANNSNGFGAAAQNNNINWGWIHSRSYGHDETNLVGAEPPEPSFFDQFGTPAAAYSLRDLSGSNPNVIEVRRSSENAVQDFTSSEITNGSLATWVGAGNDGFVRTWYDQSGNGVNAIQTTAVSQPKIVNAGALITKGGSPSVQFDGINDFLESALNNPFVFNGPISVLQAVYKNASAYKAFETIFSAGTVGNPTTNASKSMGFNFLNNGLIPQPTISTDIWQPSGVLFDGSITTNTRFLIGYFISNWQTHRSTGLSNITSNGADLSTLTYGSSNPTALNTNPIKIGVFDSILSTSFFGGEIQEIIAYNEDKNSERVAIQENINNHYSIY